MARNSVSVDNAAFQKVTAAFVRQFMEKVGKEKADALSNAIGTAIAHSSAQARDVNAADAAKVSAWEGWNNAARMLAEDGADKDTARFVIAAFMPKDASELTVKSVNTYASRVCDLVPLYAMPPEEYAKVWARADIKEDGEPKAPTFDITHADAVKLLRAAKTDAVTPAELYRRNVAKVAKALANMAKPDPDERKALPNDAARKAIDAKYLEAANQKLRDVAALLGMELDTGETDEETGDDLPDVTAEGEQKETAEGEQKEAANG